MAFHKMWRGHNREHVLATDQQKNEYLRALAKHKAKAQEHVKLFAYCLMENHTHETGGFADAAKGDEAVHDKAISLLGNWMRAAHSAFGAWYNAVNKREGKVAYDRPKTKPITDDEQLLTTMAYGDANPVRAGMVKHPSKYKFSSYQFYAFGKKDEFTEMLDVPDAYLALGKNNTLRREKYRRHVDAYLRDAGLLDDEPLEDPPFWPDSTEECVDCNGLWDSS